MAAQVFKRYIISLKMISSIHYPHEPNSYLMCELGPRVQIMRYVVGQQQLKKALLHNK